MPKSQLIHPKVKEDGSANPEFMKPYHYGQTVERPDNGDVVVFRVTGITNDGVYGIRLRTKHEDE